MHLGLTQLGVGPRSSISNAITGSFNEGRYAREWNAILSAYMAHTSTKLAFIPSASGNTKVITIIKNHTSTNHWSQLKESTV